MLYFLSAAVVKVFTVFGFVNFINFVIAQWFSPLPNMMLSDKETVVILVKKTKAL